MPVWFSQTVILVGLLLMTVGLAIPKPDSDKKERVVDKPLSDKEHFPAEGHNAEFDHQAFLGEEAKTFDQLSPEESIRRLGLIVDKIDKDKNGFVSEKELKEWIQYTQKRYILDDVDRQWKTHNPEKKEKLTWDDYKRVTYGFMEDMDENDIENEDNRETYKDMIARDLRRWKAADQDSDDALNKDEFMDFLHPEETPHMQHIVISETIMDIDKDGDGKISVDEYIGDMYTGSDGDEPDWVHNERDQFKNYRDKNKDGYMDTQEVREWILPPDYDHSEAEAKHLIKEADSDRDKQLTKEEVINKYDLFVGSQATDFGEALTKHDEF